jgi:hypothetical protein
MIFSRLGTNPEEFSLFEHIQFEYLSTAGIASFVMWVSNHFDLLNFGVSVSLCSRLKRQISSNSRNPRAAERVREVKLESPLSHNLATYPYSPVVGGKVDDRGIVAVSGKIQTQNSGKVAVSRYLALDVVTGQF